MQIPRENSFFFCLVDNALRHGNHVTEISTSCCCDDLGCTLSIQHNGIGIEPDEKTLIFERGNGKNTGYGLFLARQILDLNNMTIHETGGFGQGAGFDIDSRQDRFGLFDHEIFLGKTLYFSHS